MAQAFQFGYLDVNFPKDHRRHNLSLPLKVLEIPLEARLCFELHVSPWFGLCGMRELQGFLRIKRDWKRRLQTYITFLFIFVGFLHPFLRGVSLSFLQLNWFAVCDYTHGIG